jgi:hypothetical protein
VHYCEKENLYLVVVCDSYAHHSVWAALTATIEGGPVGISEYHQFEDPESGK